MKLNATYESVPSEPMDVFLGTDYVERLYANRYGPADFHFVALNLPTKKHCTRLAEELKQLNPTIEIIYEPPITRPIVRH